MVDGGVRISWEEVPAHVRAGIEDLLGSPVVEAISQAGGFSPGTADRVVLADGRRAFVKAVGTSLNPDTPGIHRQEIAVMKALPPDLPAPRLLGSYDDGDWVALALTDVDGRHPATPWKADELALVLDGLNQLSRALTPTPLPGLRTVWDIERRAFTAWPRLAVDAPDDLEPWAVRNLERLLAASEPIEEALAGDTLVHLDIRADNLLLTETGVVFVDWPWASRGAPWTDLGVFLCSVASIGGSDPEEISRTHPLLTDVEPAALTAVIAALIGYWAEASRGPEAPGLPTVRAFQRRSSVACMEWLARRTGWH